MKTGVQRLLEATACKDEASPSTNRAGPTTLPATGTATAQKAALNPSWSTYSSSGSLPCPPVLGILAQV